MLAAFMDADHLGASGSGSSAGRNRHCLRPGETPARDELPEIPPCTFSNSDRRHRRRGPRPSRRPSGRAAVGMIVFFYIALGETYRRISQRFFWLSRRMLPPGTAQESPRRSRMESHQEATENGSPSPYEVQEPASGRVDAVIQSAPCLGDLPLPAVIELPRHWRSCSRKPQTPGEGESSRARWSDSSHHFSDEVRRYIRGRALGRDLLSPARLPGRGLGRGHDRGCLVGRPRTRSRSRRVSKRCTRRFAPETPPLRTPCRGHAGGGLRRDRQRLPEAGRRRSGSGPSRSGVRRSVGSARATHASGTWPLPWARATMSLCSVGCSSVSLSLQS
jgi:hypothetical protein